MKRLFPLFNFDMAKGGHTLVELFTLLSLQRISELLNLRGHCAATCALAASARTMYAKILREHHKSKKSNTAKS
jgi:hypothetical protein